MNFDKLLNPEVLLFLVGGLIAIVTIVGRYVNAHFKDQGDRELKQMMLEHGKSVEEIERVLLAGNRLSTKEGKPKTPSYSTR